MMKFGEVDYTTLVPNETTPERAFFAAMLEMAFRDLNAPEHFEACRSAIAWFNNKRFGENETSFSFKFVRQVLDLNDDQIAFLQETARHAEAQLSVIRIRRQSALDALRGTRDRPR